MGFHGFNAESSVSSVKQKRGGEFIPSLLLLISLFQDFKTNLQKIKLILLNSKKQINFLKFSLLILKIRHIKLSVW